MAQIAISSISSFKNLHSILKKSKNLALKSYFDDPESKKNENDDGKDTYSRTSLIFPITRQSKRHVSFKDLESKNEKFPCNYLKDSHKECYRTDIDFLFKKMNSEMSLMFDRQREILSVIIDDSDINRLHNVNDFHELLDSYAVKKPLETKKNIKTDFSNFRARNDS
ncbi:unnamed protein product [Blepharisma stoltei]|uniref:Uncharacterized protein n=1 Tax=Blepharisma stoltei TaxID=1481888 RepID=A0AAU9K269_9CILI|nr:unnamed protein product [Blepharisma stoltei]